MTYPSGEAPYVFPGAAWEEKHLGKNTGHHQSVPAAAEPCTHLFKGIPSNCLEGLLHIDGFLGTGLKVGNVVFAVAPSLCPLCGHLQEGGHYCHEQLQDKYTGENRSGGEDECGL